MSELTGVAGSWPRALLEEAKLGVEALPRWAQRELRAQPEGALTLGFPRAEGLEGLGGLGGLEGLESFESLHSLKGEGKWEGRELEEPEWEGKARGQLLRLEAVSSEDETLLSAQVRSLGHAEFREDVLEIVERGGLWQARALMKAEQLIGFVVYGVLHGSMSLRYIAVVPEHRGKGHGRRLVQYVSNCCWEQNVQHLSLFSKRELVAFYKALGFCEVPDEDGDSEDDLQVPLVMSPLSPLLAAGTKQLEEEPRSAPALKRVEPLSPRLEPSSP